MARKPSACALLLILLMPALTYGATFWTGPRVTVSKAPGADFRLAANQDRLTATVWLTRGDIRGLFNIAQEPFYDPVPPVDSPAGTMWAVGSLANGVQQLTFQTWVQAMQNNPPSMLNVPMVVHLLADDIYFDFTLTSWGQGTAGLGAFTYTRSSPASDAPPARQVPFPPFAQLLAALLLGAIGLRAHRR